MRTFVVSWKSRFSSPAEAGWSAAGLNKAKRLSKTMATTSWVVVQGGKIVDEYGAVEKPVLVHSMRKSIISALYGIYVAKGKINLSATLAELGIDDLPPSLSAEEKTAKVSDLLKARSGVYHETSCEPESMKEHRPARHSHPPGTHWFYNNWDFNALGTIFQQQTGKTVFDAFDEHIARRIGLEHFVEARDTRNAFVKESKHPCYLFWLSAYDMARFGLVYLHGGRWREHQIVPGSWVTESTTSYSHAGKREGYGYLWWIGLPGEAGAKFPEGTFAARGSHGQIMVVVPKYDLVIVHNATGTPGVTNGEVDKLLVAIVDSRQGGGEGGP